MEEDRKEVELEEARVVITLPTNAVEAKIEVTVFENGGLVRTERTLTCADLRQAFKDGECVILDDDILTITDEGRKYLESLKG